MHFQRLHSVAEILINWRETKVYSLHRNPAMSYRVHFSLQSERQSEYLNTQSGCNQKTGVNLDWVDCFAKVLTLTCILLQSSQKNSKQDMRQGLQDTENKEHQYFPSHVDLKYIKFK